MSGTMKNKILLSGAPIAWLFEFTSDSGNVEGLLLKYRFDNLQSASIIASVAGDIANAGSNIDITRADGGIIRFPAESLIIDGTDETEIVESGGSDASGKGTASLVLNEAPIESVSMTEFLADLKANKDSKFLLVVPTGYTYSRLGTGATRKPDGFIYGIVKLTSDINLNLANSPVPITLEFAAQKHSAYAGDLTVASDPHPFDGNGIEVKRGGANNVPASLNVPLELTTDEQDDLMLGEFIIKANVA